MCLNVGLAISWTIVIATPKHVNNCIEEMKRLKAATSTTHSLDKKENEMKYDKKEKFSLLFFTVITVKWAR